ncbi:MAG: MurR/RpiR family transcriptional regulator, partial [Trichococcus flocculiformis]
KMNFSGWSDLKEAFLKEEEYLQKHFSEINANLPFQRNDTILSIASKIAALEKESIDDTLSLITHDDLQKAIQIIRKSSYTSLFAVSNNLLITQEFQHNMARIKKRVDICSLQGETIFKAHLADPSSCAIIVSYSGETSILNETIQYLKANKIPIIAITNIGDNTTARLADCVLRICTREKLYSKIATFSTDSAIVYLLDVLYSCIFALDYDANLQLRISTSKMIEAGRSSTVDIIKEEDHASR